MKRFIQDENLEGLAGRANKSVNLFVRKLNEFLDPEVMRVRYASCKNSKEVAIAILKDCGIKEVTEVEFTFFSRLKMY